VRPEARLNLNRRQREIVKEPIQATVKAVAGAGTGKTRVLVERYLKFVFEDGISPDHLLALTFTKKAAAEMHGRVFDRVVAAGDKEVLRALYGAWIMNFHQFAFRVIKENAAAFGIDPDVGVASEVDLLRLHRGLQRRFEAGAIEGLPHNYEDDMPVPNRIGRYFDGCMDVVVKARETLWTPPSLLDTVRPEDLPAYRRYVETIVAIWKAYEEDLRSRLLLDFSDMIRIVVDEFSRNERLRRQYAKRFVHVLVDEFQDTSEAQNELLRLLTGGDFPHVTVVGDEKQSIYRWRDARVENIREFTGVERILNTNYRSTQGILDLAHHVLIEDEYFNERAEEIHLVANRGQGEAPVCVFHPEDESEPSPAEEAKALGAWILALTGRCPAGVGALEHYVRNSPGLGFGDIAVLMRSLKPGSGLPSYEDELRRLGIPYAIVGGVSHLDDRVLESMKNLLRLLFHPGDVRSFLSVIEEMPFALPDQSIRELLADGARRFELSQVLSGDNLANLSDPDARGRLSSLRDALADLNDKWSMLDLGTFITEAMEYTQFFYRMFAEGADLRVVDSISKRIFELVEQLTHRHEANLAALLEAIQTLLDKKQLGEEDAPYVPKDRVVVMTQHQAKGLEFPAVAIPGIRKKDGREKDSFFLVRGQGLYTSVAENWGRGQKACVAAEAAKLEKAQEERCLLYVAMTRAKDHLFLSSPLPNGVDRQKKASFFASVLRALKENNIPHAGWRTTPHIEPTTRIGDTADPGESVDPRALIDEWESGHERIEESRGVTRPTPRGLQFVSWRALHAFGSCPLQYYYRYIVGIQDDLLTEGGEITDEDEPVRQYDAVAPPKGMSPEEFGGFVHRFLYEWWGLDETTEESARRVADDVAGRFRLAGATRKQVVEAAIERVTALREKMPWRNEEVYRREWPIQARVGRLVLHGIVDRVDRTDQGLSVIDYKVGAVRHDYTYQVQFYAWMLDRVSDTPVTRGTVAYLRREAATTSVDVSEGALAAIGSAAQRLEEAIDTGQYHAAPGVVCESCDFNRICRHATSRAVS
jgi:DNA helicase-2/ATP-dependent DNA helicase PcrA